MTVFIEIILKNEKKNKNNGSGVWTRGDLVTGSDADH